MDAIEGGDHDAGRAAAPEKVRVWWEPTDDRKRTGFGGAWWPAQVISRHKNKLRVKYDNGDEEDVTLDHISPVETLPVDFGEEEYVLSPGEFCEVHNGSKTDPCAWLGKVIKVTKAQVYTVEYPFHNAKPERIQPNLIRRARIMEDGEWRLIKPNQTWESGDVSSPVELELIHEDELEEHLDFEEDGAGGSGTKRAHSADPESSGEDEDQDKKAAKRPKTDGKPKFSSTGKPVGRPRKHPLPEAGTAAAAPAPAAAPKAAAKASKADAPGPAAAASASGPSPTGTLSLYVTIEPAPGEQTFCFMPVGAGVPVPPHAIQVYFPYSAVPQLREAARAQLHGNGRDSAAAAAAAAKTAKPKPGAGGTALPPAERAKASSGEATVKEEKMEKVKKRGKSAWHVFLERHRRTIAEANPGLNLKEMNALLGKMYKEMSAEERALCEAEAGKDSRAVAAATGAGNADKPKKTVLAPAVKEPAAKEVKESKPAQAPVAPFSAQQLYTEQFLKALVEKSGVSASSPAALKAAADAWSKVEVHVREKYEEKAKAELKRYNRELKMWNMVQLAAKKKAQEVNVEDVDDVLNRGIDLKQVKSSFLDLGLAHEAYMLLVDSWRKTSPRLHDVVKCYKSHVHGRDKADWEAFLVELLGAQRVQALKRPLVVAMQGQPI